MLANLPHKIPVPFNLLGDEAKLAFRSQPGGIAKLATTRVCAMMIQGRLLLMTLLLDRISRRQNRTGTRYVDVQTLCAQTGLTRSQYVTLFDSASDVFTLISHNDGMFQCAEACRITDYLNVCHSPPRVI